MNYLRVKNWGEFQHYKDRNPPWIKLHRALLHDYAFSKLADATKGQLVLIWLLASQDDGRVPDDPKFIKEKLGLDKLPDLQALVDKGFLILEQSASTTPEQDASNALDLARSREKRREEAEEKVGQFGRFWLAYPKRVAKQAAQKAWKQLNPTPEQVGKLMAALERAKASPDWQKDGGRFVPHPATWLNGRRFEDELPHAATPRVVEIGKCECGAPATVKVGNKPRCGKHVRGIEEAA